MVTEQPLPAEMATGSAKAGFHAVLSHHKQTVLKKNVSLETWQDVTVVTEQPLPAEMATGSEKKAGFNAVLSHHKQTVLNKLFGRM